MITICYLSRLNKNQTVIISTVYLNTSQYMLCRQFTGIISTCDFTGDVAIAFQEQVTLANIV